MKYKVFKEIIEELIQIKKDVEGISNAVRKFEPDFNYISFGRYENLTIKILREAFNDKNDWISYWLYELDYGEKARIGSVKNEKGKSIPIKTIKDLYNILINKEI